MNLRSGRLPAIVLLLGFAGCANPADESTPAKVGEPVAVEEVTPPPPPTEGTPEGAVATTPAVATAASGLPIDAQASKIEFVGSKVTGSHTGGFKDFNGAITLNADGTQVESVRAEIDMDSTYTDADGLTRHLKNADFFDVAKYPKSTFQSTAISPGGEKGASHTITGNFTLHGVTKSISFPATIKVDSEAVTIDSDFFIDRKSFDIEYAGKADDLIRDEVVIKLGIRAPKG